MALSNEKIMQYTKRILLSRTRLLCEHGFYGLLLMHMRFFIDEECETAATDGDHIFFGPDFLKNLTDSELDFVMMHEILHIALKHCWRSVGFEPERYNIAADIVVNSNILYSNNMDFSCISLGGEPAMHLTPDALEGYHYTVEEVYNMLPPTPQSIPKAKVGSAAKTSASNPDSHDKWGCNEESEDSYKSDLWDQRIQKVCETMIIRNPSNKWDTIPMCAQRMLKEFKDPQTDWRTILNNFVQEEIADYSFTPPDRRFEDNPFYLPDFNEKSDAVSDILFMIDTSGSISDDMLTTAYSEIKGAIDQFDGRLKGWLGFFDAEVVEPTPFENEDEFRIIKPYGGGGTNFHVVFNYVRNCMNDNPPASIVILTDGYAPFPEKVSADGIPVLWLLNNETVQPPWGKVARFKVD